MASCFIADVVRAAGVVRIPKNALFSISNGNFLKSVFSTSTAARFGKDDQKTTFHYAVKGRVPRTETVAAAKKRLLQSKQNFKLKSDRLKTRIDEAKTVIRDKVQVIRRENIWTVPNILCVTRIAICPYLSYTILTADYKIALSIFVIAGISDYCDGVIARNFKSQSTVLGSLLDPLADKLLIGTVYLSMTYAGLLPTALTLIVMGRDVLLASAAFYLRYLSLPQPRSLTRYFDPSYPTVQMQPLAISKFNTVVQIFTAVASLAVPLYNESSHANSMVSTELATGCLTGLWWLTAATTLGSLFSYVRLSSSTYKMLQDSHKKEKGKNVS
ncbi:Cardiolipin synthase [Nesidiocoris tenuis]|uniref:cardiolipin synthase (CMP-forming) n=1 Tax=Nesidiocoris tenuis TaxID=355587 RepID=A0ABN7B7W9_9HEMI|nr:Cardiolipin synthase [Nesidiocoris tenuis]